VPLARLDTGPRRHGAQRGRAAGGVRPVAPARPSTNASTHGSAQAGRERRRGRAEQLETLEAFIRANDLVTIPGTERRSCTSRRRTARQLRVYQSAGSVRAGPSAIYYVSRPIPSGARRSRSVRAGRRRPALHERARGLAGPLLQFQHRTASHRSSAVSSSATRSRKGGRTTARR